MTFPVVDLVPPGRHEDDARFREGFSPPQKNEVTVTDLDWFLGTMHTSIRYLMIICLISLLAGLVPPLPSLVMQTECDAALHVVPRGISVLHVLSLGLVLIHLIGLMTTLPGRRWGRDNAVSRADFSLTGYWRRPVEKVNEFLGMLSVSIGMMAALCFAPLAIELLRPLIGLVIETPCYVPEHAIPVAVATIHMLVLTLVLVYLRRLMTALAVQRCEMPDVIFLDDQPATETIL